MTENSGQLMVICSCPEGETGRDLARQLVERRVAACVQVIPGVESVFRWQGAVDQARECLLLIKTAARCYGQLEHEIRKLHPYDVPEIIALPITGGLPDYLAWIASNTLLE